MRTIDLILRREDEMLGDRNELLDYLKNFKKPDDFSPATFCFKCIEWELRFDSSEKLVLSNAYNEFTKLDFSELSFKNLIEVVEHVKTYENDSDRRTETRDLVTLLEILCDYIKDWEKDDIRPFSGLCLLLQDLSDDFMSEKEKIRIHHFLLLMWKNRVDQSLTLDSMSGFMFPIGNIEKRVEFLETCIALLRVLEIKNL